ncbi:hypothetical protein MKX03_000614 [Papaver bracteatum]|nr:hypothetical protein MKX03_000614 [Papaver bracteatum]
MTLVRPFRRARSLDVSNLVLVPLRRSQRLTPQTQIPQNLDCDASRKRKGKAVVHDNRAQIPQNLDCDASRKRKGKAVVHDNQVLISKFASLSFFQ